MALGIVTIVMFCICKTSKVGHLKTACHYGSAIETMKCDLVGRHRGCPILSFFLFLFLCFIGTSKCFYKTSCAINEFSLVSPVLYFYIRNLKEVPSMWAHSTVEVLCGEHSAPGP